MRNELENVAYIKSEYNYNEIELKTAHPLFENLIWLSTDETAQFLRKKSSHAIRQMVYKGKLHPRKFQGRLYFNKLELHNLVDSSHY
ncbi:MAG: helix-turn-helix domain-containing protein [Bacteriovoracaceae bacterium]